MRSIFVFYAFLLGYVHGNGQSCPRDSVGHAVYGPECKYLCHCKENEEQCDDATGRCVSGCAHEWMGPGCQYRDILWGKETMQLNGNNAYKTVDGNADTCSSTMTRDGPLWWKSWFEQPEIIRGMTIITKEANIGSFSRFKVYVEENTKQKSNTEFQRQEICYEHDGVRFLTTTITVICVRPLRGNQIRIQLDSTQTQLVLCDVRVFGGRNLAYSKQTSQSSTYLDSISSNAVDGSTNTTNYHKCAFTDYNDPSKQWTVNLGKVVKVQALELISEDRYKFRSGDVIQAGVDLNLYSLQFPSSQKRNLFFTTNSSIRYLQIKRNELGHLAICEAFVFGDCLDNECGLDCSIPCYCAAFKFDNKVSGQCQEGCAAGWTGQGHMCDTECPDGTYGERCRGRCQGNFRCDKRDGSFEGCKPGWKGDTCNDACASWNYGYECQERCSGHCLDNDICDKIDGHCARGCAAGWRGDKCDAACTAGTFGLNCSRHCSGHCLDNDVCDNVGGHCSQGCAAGWRGDMCDKVCVQGYYGPKCINVCSDHCFISRVCDPKDGRCESGCGPGWTGDNCIEQCNDGTYGLSCSGVCHCVNNDVCDKVNGRCFHGCAAGWTGEACNSVCVPGSYGLGCMKLCTGHCVNKIACDNVRGHCPQGCAAGWIGDKCDKGCNDGTYGRNCLQHCSGHCEDSDVCGKVNGHCPRGCDAGWEGDKCEEECSSGSYGVNCREKCSLHCKDERICDKTNGKCVGGCKAGWQGLTCLTECKNHTYGAECSGHCSGNCLDKSVCDKEDGHCSRGCAAGWKGQKCDTEIICPVNTFGLDCTPCGPCKNGSCDPVTGKCPSGCFDGYVGSMCETFNCMYTVNAGLVGAGVGVAVTLLVVAVIVAVLWKIKQRPHIYEEPLPMTSSGPINEPHYDTCQDQGRPKEKDSDQEHVYMN